MYEHVEYIPTRVPAESSQKSSLYLLHKQEKTGFLHQPYGPCPNKFIFISYSENILQMLRLAALLFILCMAFIQILLLYYYKTGEGIN